MACGTRDQTRIPCIGSTILNHWATREVSCSVRLDSLNRFLDQIGRDPRFEKALVQMNTKHLLSSRGCHSPIPHPTVTLHAKLLP